MSRERVRAAAVARGGRRPYFAIASGLAVAAVAAAWMAYLFTLPYFLGALNAREVLSGTLGEGRPRVAFLHSRYTEAQFGRVGGGLRPTPSDVEGAPRRATDRLCGHQRYRRGARRRLGRVRRGHPPRR